MFCSQSQQFPIKMQKDFLVPVIKSSWKSSYDIQYNAAYLSTTNLQCTESTSKTSQEVYLNVSNEIFDT